MDNSNELNTSESRFDSLAIADELDIINPDQGEKNAVIGMQVAELLEHGNEQSIRAAISEDPGKLGTYQIDSRDLRDAITNGFIPESISWSGDLSAKLDMLDSVLATYSDEEKQNASKEIAGGIPTQKDLLA